MTPAITRDPAVLTRDAAIVATAPLARLEARGADRIGFLHRLLTADVQSLAPGAGTHALLLTAKGQLTSDMYLFVAPEHVDIVVAAAQAEETATALSHFAIMDDFSCAPVAGAAFLSLYGARAPERLVAAGLGAAAGLAAAPPWTHVAEDGAWLARVPGYGTQGIWVCAAPARVAALETALAQAGMSVLDPELAEGLRIEAGGPRHGHEFGVSGQPPRFPMETGLGDAVDYDKGCYLGQEPIVRIRDRGHVNWRLARLRFSGPGAWPAPGDALTSEARPAAGKLTSVAHAPGGPDDAGVALAIVHVSVPDGSAVEIVTAAGVRAATLHSTALEG